MLFGFLSGDSGGVPQGWKRVVDQIRKRGVGASARTLMGELEKDQCGWKKENKGKGVREEPYTERGKVRLCCLCSKRKGKVKVKL